MAGTPEDDAVDVQVVREPLTYERSAPRSYFQDLVLRANRQDRAATNRLEAHADEMRVELPRRELRDRAIADAAGVELRVNPNRADGQGGFASPPLWLIDDIALTPRPGRVLSDMIPSFPLPSGVSEVNVPRLTSGTQVQVTADGGAVADNDITDAAVTSPVVPITGDGDMALQLLEQSPPGAHLDHAIFRDLSNGYDARLETLLVNGTGTGGQLLGLLQVPAGAGLANAVTYTDATPTASELMPFTGQAVAQVGDNRLLPPEIWLMRTAREAWILFGEDAQQRPFTTPGHTAAPKVDYLFDDRRPTQGAPLGTYPIYRSDVIPATLGAGGNQDAIISCRPSDMMLLETTPRVRMDVQSLSGTMGVRLQLIGYAAALVARYPTGIATITGTGLIVQPGY